MKALRSTAALVTGAILIIGFQNATVPSVIGSVEMMQELGRTYLLGWTCQVGNPASTSVNVYAGASAYDQPKGTLVLKADANLPSTADTAQKCQTSTPHNFKIEIKHDLEMRFAGQPIFVHGIRAESWTLNTALPSATPLAFTTLHPSLYWSPERLADVRAQANDPIVKVDLYQLRARAQELLNKGGTRYEDRCRLKDITSTKLMLRCTVGDPLVDSFLMKNPNATTAEFVASLRKEGGVGAGKVALHLALASHLLKGQVPDAELDSYRQRSRDILMNWVNNVVVDNKSGHVVLEDGGRFGLYLGKSSLMWAQVMDLLNQHDGFLTDLELQKARDWLLTNANWLRIAKQGWHNTAAVPAAEVSASLPFNPQRHQRGSNHISWHNTALFAIGGALHDSEMLREATATGVDHYLEHIKDVIFGWNDDGITSDDPVTVQNRNRPQSSVGGWSSDLVKDGAISHRGEIYDRFRGRWGRDQNAGVHYAVGYSTYNMNALALQAEMARQSNYKIRLDGHWANVFDFHFDRGNRPENQNISLLDSIQFYGQFLERYRPNEALKRGRFEWDNYYTCSNQDQAVMKSCEATTARIQPGSWVTFAPVLFYFRNDPTVRRIVKEAYSAGKFVNMGDGLSVSDAKKRVDQLKLPTPYSCVLDCPALASNAELNFVGSNIAEPQDPVSFRADFLAIANGK